MKDARGRTPAATAARGVEDYYRLHARIYDATRWSFLFGRSALIRNIGAHCHPRRVLEVGCGTGKNLRALRRAFPRAQLTGVDLSSDMLGVAARKLRPLAGSTTLVHRSYEQPLDTCEPFDVVVFSYALSMFNPGWDRALECAAADLAPGGLLAVVDFHASPLAWFRRWMSLNHVRMEAHLLPAIAGHFDPVAQHVCSAYAGVWSYFTFLGRKDRR